MKNLIVCESIHHGNTEKIGKAIAEYLNADLIKTNDVNVNTLEDYDLIGFGSGIYNGKLIGGIAKGRPNENDIQKAKEFAEKLK